MICPFVGISYILSWLPRMCIFDSLWKQPPILIFPYLTYRVVVIIISIWHWHSSQESTMLLQFGWPGTNPVIGHTCVLPKVCHRRASWICTWEKDERLFLQCHPRPPPFPEMPHKWAPKLGRFGAIRNLTAWTKHQLTSSGKCDLSTCIEHAFKLLGGQKLRWATGVHPAKQC